MSMEVTYVFFFLLLSILSMGLNMCIKTDNCLFFKNIVKIHVHLQDVLVMITKFIYFLLDINLCDQCFKITDHHRPNLFRFDRFLNQPNQTNVVADNSFDSCTLWPSENSWLVFLAPPTYILKHSSSTKSAIFLKHQTHEKTSAIIQNQAKSLSDVRLETYCTTFQ